MAVKSDLSQGGFVANSVKSIWVPVQSVRWLGYQWDLKHNLLSIPVEKIDRLLASIDIVLLQSRLPARQLASVTGSIISNMLVFGNVCKVIGLKANTGLSIACKGGIPVLNWTHALAKS